ncbi:MAG: TolC family protein [Pseudomonadales bacterium]|nr:hypothetical protein [Pseudomonadales bacterium]MCG8314389.1 TolC family protein [Pseudomonadales bacterium]
MPLYSDNRNRSNVNAILNAREQADFRRNENLVTLHNQLFSAYSQRLQFIDTYRRLKKEVIPSLAKALSLTKDAYDRGRLKYQDWIAAQQELLGAKQQLIDAASATLINQALIEQLTAEPLTD